MSIDRGHGIATSSVLADSYDLDALITDTEAAKLAAQAAQTASELALDTFDDRYLGAKAADPTVDNDGDALINGVMFYDTALNITKIYDLASTTWKRTTPTTTDQTNIDTVSGKATEIGRLGTADAVADMAILGTTDVVADLNTLGTAAVVTDMNILGTADVVLDMNTLGTSGNVTNMNTLAGISADITTVSGISANTSIVSGISANVTSVAGNAANINSAVSNATNINTVATNITDVSKVADDIVKVVAVADDLADAVSEVVTVADDLNEAVSEIDTVATNITNVNTVGASITNVNTVAGLASDVAAVAGDATNISTVATNIIDVNSFANKYRIAASAPTTSLDSGDLWWNTASSELRAYDTGGSTWQATAPSSTDQVNINIVAGDVTYSEDLGSITVTPTTSSGNGDITTVANGITNVGTVAAISSNVTTVAGISGDVTTVSGISANVTSVANNEVNINRYADEYTISATNPGSPSAGDLWYDSVSNTLKYNTGTIWASISAGISDVVSDNTPQLGGSLDGQDNNMTNIGTISGSNLQLDFGGLT
jgi:hypothetical protein